MTKSWHAYQCREVVRDFQHSVLQVTTCFRFFQALFWVLLAGRYKYVAASVCNEVWRVVEIIYMEFNFSLEFVYCSAMLCLFGVIAVSDILATC